MYIIAILSKIILKMLTKNFAKRDLLFLVLSIGASLLIYGSLFNGFFQQDEWLGYARHVLLTGSTLPELAAYAFTPGLGHFTPLTPLLVYFSFSFFGLNYTAHVLITLVLHSLMIFLFYNFSKFFFSLKFAFFSTLLFGLTAASFQGTAWVVADIGTHMSSIFGLLSLIFITNFLVSSKSKFLTLSICTLFVSLLFKELTVGLFVVLPLIIIFWGKLFSKKQKVKYSSIILFTGVIYLTFRIFLLIGLSNQLSTEYSQGTNSVIYNLFTVPIKSISQTLIPVDILKELSFKASLLIKPEIRGDYGSPQFEVFAVKRVLEAISIISSLGLIIFILKFIKSGENKRIALFSIIFIMLNSAIIALAPEKQGIISAIDSRNLYFISIGSSVLLVALLKNLSKTYFIVSFIIILALNTYILTNSLSEFNSRGRVRRDILQEITKSYPLLPNRIIFYTESDTPFYGLPENERVLPFQSGFGQTLLSWYYDKQNFPKVFFESRFLWDIESQGYREFEKLGFGYFRDFEMLAKIIKKRGLPQESVISYRYDSTESLVFDISEEVRGRLTGYFVDKRKLELTEWQVIIDNTTQEVGADETSTELLKDGKRETAWSSISPYSNSQSLTLEFDYKPKIALIRLDAYNNKDQNNVGYKIVLSENGEEWKTVFYSRKYPPDQQGKTDINIKPLPAKYIRIEQVGYHQFSPWIIHEMELYETIEK